MVEGKTRFKQPASDEPAPPAVPVDPFRHFVFPNRVREQRQLRGYAKLLRLASVIPEIPYIRLSKIERGEVVPRPEELRRIAAALDIAPADLLLDTDAPDFDIAGWAEPFGDGTRRDPGEERFAVLLAAAVRARCASDPAVTIASIERDFGLAPVNLSRIENASKPFHRWKTKTQRAIFALFGVPDEGALREHVEAHYRSGALDTALRGIADAETRRERTRLRIAETATALESGDVPAAPGSSVRSVPVLRSPLPDGLIAGTPSGEEIMTPCPAGPRTFALKVCRATLGGGLPAQAMVIVDPDRYPAPGGLAALREDAGWRLLSVGSGRDGRMVGYSVNPELEVSLDDRDPSVLAAVIGAIFP
jgi:transcriptional regulator with XRE-family HTH domain